MKTRIVLSVAVAFVLMGTLGCPPCDGPDLRATDIAYTKLNNTTDTSGDVTISGIITNKGGTAFQSGEGQQSVFLYEGSDLVAQQPFRNVEVNGTVSVSFTRNWSTQDEFRPPSYTVEISLDPDIFIDGNENNDDCNTGNNSRAETTAALDALFD